MPRALTVLELLFIILLALWVVVDLVRTRRLLTGALQLLALALLVIVLYLATGFPQSDRVSFGPSHVEGALMVMAISVVLGIAARYIFYLRGRFSWAAFLKPLVISPIILLPLIGSLQGASSLEPLQMVSLGCLSFQNGFFWQMVLENARRDIPRRAMGPQTPQREPKE
jgi:hypothetical protein